MPHETSMSAASRKAWNLKVIQRHDPDIVCIWDQVSYVMLMQYSGSQWSKTSVEGSLFLFDRRGFPRYGFFILNRSSAHNYIHLLTPEDNLEVRENYVIFRAKGSKDAPVMGLWASDPDHRNHLGETLLGLHAHIKSGSTETFYNPADVYGADPTMSSPSPAITTTTNYAPPPAASGSSGTGQSTNEAGGMQSLNDLFARLSSSASVNPTTAAPATTQTTLYSSQTGQAPAPNSTFAPAQAIAQPAPTPTGPLRGQALLDSLFAMASPTRAPAVVQPTSTNLSASGSFTMPQSQSSSNFNNFSAPAPSAPTNLSQPTTQSPTSSKGGDLLAQLFANLGTGPQQSHSASSTAQTHNIRHSRVPSTPPSVLSTLPADPAIIHSAKVTPEPKSERRRNNTRRGYATDTSPRPHHSHSHSHRMSVFDEDATHSHSRSTSQAADDVLTALNGSVRNKPRAGRALVPFQSDTGPVYHPDPTRPHVSNRFPAGENGEEEKVYAMGVDEEAEDEIFYDGRGNRGKGPSPRRQRRRKNGRGGANGSEGGRNGEVVNLDRQTAGDVLMQGIEWDEGVVDKQLFLQSIHALLNEPEFVDQLYNDYKIAQTQRTS
ncbi:unnamed protein product [Rhizoctonia solani]|uniref:mRNA-decapping enzyme 1B n=1 Tax=Rhizoctonia solani TaxID=456999 RepID=A0A8H2XL61_9AGAM|nr:unnamed protein product [Rhizoctonia solani]